MIYNPSDMRSRFWFLGIPFPLAFLGRIGPLFGWVFNTLFAAEWTHISRHLFLDAVPVFLLAQRIRPVSAKAVLVRLGLAAMIFGNWNPIAAYASSLIFGFADSLQVKMQILKIPIPSEFLGMAPYLVTMIILGGFVGRVHPPDADGSPYQKE